jgi:calcineurin-like phosphoesterase family protein
MNEALLANLNNMVGQDDTLYFLGDFCFGGHDLTPKWRARINCKNVYWMKGNHDAKQHLYKDHFTFAGDTLNVTIQGQPIFMSHYSHRIWEGSHKGYWHLYGHSHASAEAFPWGKSMDVGVDNAYRLFGEYRPFTFDEVKRILDKREIAFIDHHSQETNVR